MTPTEQLLQSVVSELQLLRQEIKGDRFLTCEAPEAVLYLGVKDTRYLTYFAKQHLLSPRRGSRGLVYYKAELTKLAEMIRNHEVIVPSRSNLYK